MACDSPEFGRAWLRCFKAGQSGLSPFLLAVLLTLGGVPCLEKPVSDALKVCCCAFVCVCAGGMVASQRVWV